MLNREKSNKAWKPDIARSKADYDAWYPDAAKTILGQTQAQAIDLANLVMQETENFRALDADLLERAPASSYILRQAILPPLACDRLASMSGVSRSLIKRLEVKNLPPANAAGREALETLTEFFTPLLDPGLLPWVSEDRDPTDAEAARALVLLADRHSVACFNTLFRNTQEARQKGLLRAYLRDPHFQEVGPEVPAMELSPGTFSMGRIILGEKDDGSSQNLPMDCVISPFDPELPLVAVEMKSAGDYANVNKRKKEEADKNHVLNRAQEGEVVMVLQLFGYFGDVYLSAERAAGLDWIWDHRIEDLRPYLGV